MPRGPATRSRSAQARIRSRSGSRPHHDKLKLESLKPSRRHQVADRRIAPARARGLQHADNVSLRGFMIAGPFTSRAARPIARRVLVENAFDEQIDHNHITMIQNSVPALRGCQEGDAVSIGHDARGGTAPGSADLKHNLIDKYQKNGVQVFNPGSSAEVDHNEIIGPAGTVQPHAARTGWSSSAGRLRRSITT